MTRFSTETRNVRGPSKVAAALTHTAAEAFGHRIARGFLTAVTGRSDRFVINAAETVILQLALIIEARGDAIRARSALDDAYAKVFPAYRPDRVEAFAKGHALWNREPA